MGPTPSAYGDVSSRRAGSLSPHHRDAGASRAARVSPRRGISASTAIVSPGRAVIDCSHQGTESTGEDVAKAEENQHGAHRLLLSWGRSSAPQLTNSEHSQGQGCPSQHFPRQIRGGTHDARGVPQHGQDGHGDRQDGEQGLDVNLHVVLSGLSASTYVVFRDGGVAHHEAGQLCPGIGMVDRTAGPGIPRQRPLILSCRQCQQAGDMPPRRQRRQPKTRPGWIRSGSGWSWRRTP